MFCVHAPWPVCANTITIVAHHLDLSGIYSSMCIWRGIILFISHNFTLCITFLLIFAGHAAFAARKEPDDVSNFPSSPCGSSQGIMAVPCLPERESRAKAVCSSYQREGNLTWQPQPERFLFMSYTYGRVRALLARIIICCM